MRRAADTIKIFISSFIIEVLFRCSHNLEFAVGEVNLTPTAAVPLVAWLCKHSKSDV